MSEKPERNITMNVTVRLTNAGCVAKSDHAPLHVEHTQPTQASTLSATERKDATKKAAGRTLEGGVRFRGVERELERRVLL